MRPLPVRAMWRAMLALVLVSCSSDQLVGPQAPQRASAALVAGAAPMITEFMANPAGDDTQGEWIEIYNPSTDPVDLKNYSLASGPTVRKAGAAATDAHVIGASVVVPPGGYVVLGNNADTLTNNGLHVDYQYGTTPVLNNSNTDWITLTAPNGVLADSVAYSASTISSTFTRTITSPTYTPSASTSRAVIDLSLDNSIAGSSNWANSISTFGTAGDRGTPGEANFGGEAATVSVRATSWVTPGTTFRITAGATDVDGKPSLTTFTWASSDPTLATIDPVTGVATGVATAGGGKAGIVTITATAANGVTGTGTLFVVNAGDVASISISVNDPAQVPAGYTKPAFPTTRTTTNAVVTPTLDWSSSDPTIATVSELGYITGVSPGKVDIRATAPNGVFGTVPFTVIPADAPTSAVYRNHLEFGAPVDVNSNGTILLSKRQFVLSYDPAKGGPRWVSWNINKTQFGPVPRCDCFSADQTLPADVYHVVDFDYRNGGYDRGHMVQSESRTTTEQENAATFLLTNILPQAGANNQGPWSQFENYLNDLARLQNKEIYVVAGGIYRPDAPSLKGENKVRIPDYTWKVAVVVPAGGGLADVHSPADLQVLAIKMPNLTGADAAAGSPAFAGTPTETGNIRNKPWQDYATTVDAVEAVTGYDLLAALPNDVELLVEANDQPPAANGGGDRTGLEGSAVTFDASASSDPDGDALAYAWDFGDGTTGTGATPAHTYQDDGVYVATVTVSDPTGAQATASVKATIANVAPTAALVAPTSVYEASPIQLSLINAFDPSSVDLASLTFAFDCGDGSGYGAPGSATSASCATTDDGSRVVRGRVTDKDGAFNEYTATVTIANAAPVISNVDVPSAPTSLGGEVSVTVTASDVGADKLTTTVDWGDGLTGTSARTISTAAFTATSAGTTLTHTYAHAGVFTIVVTVADEDGGVVRSTSLPPIVIYDPTRWVNGSGWLSGPGGKTSFNSTVRYQPGATRPTGDTQYATNSGSFSFTATSYDWLVIYDGRAQYTGQGTIAGRPGTVRFLATELDGQSPDAIRLKVWDANGVIYDNAPGPDISSSSTPISGGNIFIH